MMHICYLLLHHMRYYWQRTVLLIAALFFVCVIPLGVERAVNWYAEEFHERSMQTPLLVGKRGNRFDLVLASLYFQTEYQDRIHVGDSDEAYNKDYGLSIPFLLGHSVRRLDTLEGEVLESFPLIAVDPEYYQFRSFTLQAGNVPLIAGDILIGEDMARQLSLSVGDKLVNVPQSTLDFSRSAQFSMTVCGILNATGSADDRVAFSGLQTAWILEGIGHGHEEASTLVEKGQGTSEKTNASLSSAVTTYNEITRETLDSFHFHGDPEAFPISAFFLIPATKKQQTLAIGYYRLQDSVQLVVPHDVVQELFQIIFQMKRYFVMQALGMLVIAVFLVLFISRLSQELRRQEMNALYRIGASSSTLFLLSYGELIIIFLFSIGVAYGVSYSIPWIIETFYW